MATYYVKNAGDDTKSGTSDGNAWKTIAKVNASTFAAGDSILFNRGDAWYEELIPPNSGTAGNVITFGAYGSGALPKIHSTAAINASFDSMAGFETAATPFYCENGDFEGTTTEPGWHWIATGNTGLSATTQITNPVYHGTKAMQLHRDSAGGDPGMYNGVGRSFDQECTLKFFGKTDANANIDLQIRCTVDTVTYYLQSGLTWATSPVYWFPAVIPAGTSNWTEYSLNYTMYPGAGKTAYTNHTIAFRVDDAFTCDAYIDYVRNYSKWTNYSTNVWKMLMGGTTALPQKSMLIDRKRCHFKANVGSLADDGDVYYDGANVYYVWNSVIPSSDSRTWEWIRTDTGGAFPAVFPTSKDYLTFQYLDLAGGDNYNATDLACLHFTDCDHYVVKNCTIAGSDGACIFWYYGHDGTIKYNTMYHACKGVQFGRNDDTNDIDTFDISHNSIYSIGLVAEDTGDTHFIGLYGSTGEIHNIGNGTVAYNDCYDGGGYGNGPPIGIYSSYSVLCHHNSVHHNAFGTGIKVGTGCSDIQVYNNLIWKNIATVTGQYWKGGIVIDESTGGPTDHKWIDNIKIYNNTITQNDDTSGDTTSAKGGIILHVTTSGPPYHYLENIDVKNNVVFQNYTSATTYGTELYVSTGTLTNVTLNYNCYWRTTNTANFISYGGSVYTTAQFSAYQAAKSQDANSLATDPLLANGGGSWLLATDLKLLGTSTCINGGVDVSLNSDYWGHTIRGSLPPDIGAHEYGAQFMFYDSFKKEVADGTIDLDTNTIYSMLVSSTYAFDADIHTRRSDITGEVTGTGYTAGGAAITSKAVTKNDSSDAGVFDGADVTWAGSTITARGVIIYKSTGSSATDNLICFIDFGVDKSSAGGNFTLTWNASGIFALGL